VLVIADKVGLSTRVKLFQNCSDLDSGVSQKQTKTLERGAVSIASYFLSWRDASRVVQAANQEVTQNRRLRYEPHICEESRRVGVRSAIEFPDSRSRRK
jgi:hypothetical protein